VTVAHSADHAENRWTTLLVITGFVAVAVAQVSNMIVARGNAGAIPPFSLACIRWSIIALGLAPLVLGELKAHRREILAYGWPIVLAGFCGMFLCGGPVYIAGISTTAINMALIMALSPLVVLVVSWLTGLDKIGRFQLLGLALALAGALAIVLRGGSADLMSAKTLVGDLLMVMAMLAWSGYTLLQSKAAPQVSFLGRVCMFAAVGALLSLPFALNEMWAAPHRVFNAHALGVYLFAGTVPGIFAFAGFAYLGSRFGSVRSSLVVYIGPIASALLSLVLLGEGPDAVQLAGGSLILAGVWASLRK
jgi:drug/metabolite transporter (DMT)-like permease